MYIHSYIHWRKRRLREREREACNGGKEQRKVAKSLGEKVKSDCCRPRGLWWPKCARDYSSWIKEIRRLRRREEERKEQTIGNRYALLYLGRLTRDFWLFLLPSLSPSRSLSFAQTDQSMQGQLTGTISLLKVKYKVFYLLCNCL